MLLNGLHQTSLSDVLSHCHSFTILFITETKLLSPTRLFNLNNWTQFHQYGKPVYVNPNYSRGSQGIVALVNPDCPVEVTHLLSPNPYTLSLQFGTLRISCLYLPPSLPHTQVFAALDTIPLQRDSILCGDFNARFSHLLGDEVCNPRGTLLQSWCEDRDLSILNATLAYGAPTFTRMMNSQKQQSIIDLFITNNLSVLQNPSMFVNQDLTLGSDHCILSLTFDLDIDNTPQVITDAVPPRRVWNLSRLQEQQTKELYVNTFSNNTKNVVTTLASTLEDSKNRNTRSSKPDFDALNDSLCSSIYSALDTAIGKKNKGLKNGTNTGLLLYKMLLILEIIATVAGVIQEVSIRLLTGLHISKQKNNLGMMLLQLNDSLGEITVTLWIKISIRRCQ